MATTPNLDTMSFQSFERVKVPNDGKQILETPSGLRTNPRLKYGDERKFNLVELAFPSLESSKSQIKKGGKALVSEDSLIAE